ncbi:hypothetical protein CBR_g51245 [Chara braunii]|uniref:FAS1 domain-containing protein n=1 Tax=Chara braunii TaxID=69332 RepID=A0A388M822_CHABU|nr:hypothetical protein CBR_g51245 [Chara braunii]|eukprot:GBG90738.1 hypothetical protein CBR_g51245 [Chara braunii]
MVKMMGTLSSLRMIAAILAAALISTVVAQPGRPSLPDLIDQSASRYNLSMYVEMLRSSSEALRTLEMQRSAGGGLTVLAPTNEVVAACLHRLSSCLSGQEMEQVMTMNLKYCALPGRFEEADLRLSIQQSGGQIHLPALRGGSHQLAVSEGPSKYASAQRGLFVDNAQVLPDGFHVVSTPHVIVHVIDKSVVAPDVRAMINKYCPTPAESAPSPSRVPGS